MNDRAHFSYFSDRWFMALPPFRTINRPRSYADITLRNYNSSLLFSLLLLALLSAFATFYIQTNEALLLARGKSLDTGGWVELNWNRREAKRKTSQPCSKRYASNGVDARTIGRFESQPMRCFRQPCHCASRWNEIKNNKDNITLVNRLHGNIINVSTSL